MGSRIVQRTSGAIKMSDDELDVAVTQEDFQELKRELESTKRLYEQNLAILEETHTVISRNLYHSTRT